MLTNVLIGLAGVCLGACLGVYIDRKLHHAGELLDALLADLHDVPLGDDDVNDHEKATT